MSKKKSYLTGEEDFIAKIYAGNKFNMYSSIFGYKLTFQQVSDRFDFFFSECTHLSTYIHKLWQCTWFSKSCFLPKRINSKMLTLILVI